jgi:hypothetical protein
LPNATLVQGESLPPETQEVSQMRMRSVLRHSTQAVVEGALISLLAVGLMAGTAFAAKGSGGHTKPGSGGTAGSIAVVMISDANSNGAPNWNDRITYDVSKVGVSNPFITTKCYQNGVNVLTIYAGYYAGYMWPGAQTFNLSEQNWTSGAATCTAVESNSGVTLAYNVAP